MPRPLAILLLCLMVLVVPGMTLRQTAIVHAQASGAAVQVPPIPDPVSVTLDPTTTAFLALDFQTSNCTEARRPACVASLPAVNAATAAASAAGVPIIYSITTGGTLRPEVVPGPSDVMLLTFGADKFFNTNLDDILKQNGTSTVVITGTASNGAGIYTSFEAAARGYTVVVAVDGISADTDFATLYTEWQLLTAPGTANADNTPLKPKAVTLSRTDLITYK